MYILQRHEWSPQRLFHMLEDCHCREKESWRTTPLLHSLDQQTQISPAHRDYAVTWISHLNVRFNFYPETFFLAVHNLDRFLTTVKSQPKYLKCIAATCLYIASKIMEEEQHIPGALELVEVSQAGCRPGDIIRMEKIILSKLKWNFHIPTALTYMEIFYFFAFLHDITNASISESKISEKVYTMAKQLREFTEELQRAMCNYSIAPFNSATIALSLLSIKSDEFPEKIDWERVVEQIQCKTKIKHSELNRCRYVLQTLLPQKQRSFAPLNNVVYVVSPYSRSSSKEEDSVSLAHQSAPNKRKAMEPDDLISATDCVKKFHQNEDDHSFDQMNSDAPMDSIDGSCCTKNTVKDGEVYPPELNQTCPPLEKLLNCNPTMEMDSITRKKLMTYAEIVKRGSITVCDE